MTIPWRDVFPAMTTQFRRDESLDLDATARHIEAMIDSGASGLVMLGSLGENATLEPDEKRRVVAAAIEAAHGRVPVIATVVETSTAAAKTYARDMERLGADGLMLLPAMIYRADPRETLLHYRDVARATQLPIICYNNPLAYQVDLTPAMFAELAAVPNLVAIKESSGDVRRITDLRNTVGDRYVLFAGVDDLALESAVLGADGWIAGIGLAFPRENQRLWDLAVAGEFDAARRLYRWFTPLAHLDTHVKFVQYIKLAIQAAGLGAEWVRAPRRTLVGGERRRVLGIIEAGLAQRPKLPPLPKRRRRAR
ncbi:MAG: dihydrodipicolinate synthase family protein [Steroidobacteraceae bacterium]|nr:dihydrodipicolinate synthase family protein [Steroidobacteraceae bacterium]MCW5573867.1 dihydrodipicolinate synthase family protein [Steroidobacteraceae bacterium]